MSWKIMDAVSDHEMSPAQKAVMMVLARFAKDEDGSCWPSVETIARKSSLGDRTVRRALADLKRLGWITIEFVQGRSSQYTLNLEMIMADPCRSGKTAAAARLPESPEPLPQRHDTPAAAATEYVSNNKEYEEHSIPRTRKRALPPTWSPEPFGQGTKCRKAIDGWESDEYDYQFEKFTSYHTAKGTRSADWQASWKTWVLNSIKFAGPQHGTRSAPDRANRNYPRRGNIDRRDGIDRALDRSLGFDDDPDAAGRRDGGPGAGDREIPTAQLRLVQ